MKRLLYLPLAFLIGVSFVILLPAPSAEACAVWKCCDQWGYNFPGIYLLKKGCKNAGGVVECGLQCPQAMLTPWSCCTSSGYPVKGITQYRHDCKVNGHEVHEGGAFGTACPNSPGSVWTCCDPDGGTAPGNYVFTESDYSGPHQCELDGYEPTSGLICPGGLIDTIFSALSIRAAKECALEVEQEYLVAEDANGDSIHDTWMAQSGWNDKRSHCTLACILAAQCGRMASTLAGWYKESADVCDEAQFNAWGWGDECANRLGRRYGVDLDSDGDYPQQCLDYCTTGNPDLGVAGGDCEGAIPDAYDWIQDLDGDALFGLVGFLQSGATGLFNNLGDISDDLAAFCAELAEILSGLSIASEGIVTAQHFDELEQAGLAIVAAAEDAQVGELAVGDGVVVHVIEEDAYLIAVHLPNQRRDAYLGFEDGALATVQIRGADGQIRSIAAPAGLQRVACPNPPCPARLPWLEWHQPRTSFPTVTP